MAAFLLLVQVGYNIGGPALNQLANISDKREAGVKGGAKKLRMKMRGVAAALVGLSAASLLATPHADAASEAFQLAAGAPESVICTLPHACAWVKGCIRHCSVMGKSCALVTVPGLYCVCT